MTTKKLTDLFVERVTTPARGRAEYFDASFPRARPARLGQGAQDLVPVL